ncbi:hypothetical protein CROQUDRAFT_100934 [Cronartium quercuum f. sp. fusiforme G11]|uniref:Uncharacterized protein n=1 Tax=Cronartium quercuum f. sp. fusiforme G11 TaxID=708437 RepID=A0A9P6N6N6_9BASI|nr:hypothetical protein CROQUDRAFT_100934 [Cronartium quercuum f. sp. fusiforme G11]
MDHKINSKGAFDGEHRSRSFQLNQVLYLMCDLTLPGSLPTSPDAVGLPPRLQPLGSPSPLIRSLFKNAHPVGAYLVPPFEIDSFEDEENISLHRCINRGLVQIDLIRFLVLPQLVFRVIPLRAKSHPAAFSETDKGVKNQKSRTELKTLDGKKMSQMKIPNSTGIRHGFLPKNQYPLLPIMDLSIYPLTLKSLFRFLMLWSHHLDGKYTVEGISWRLPQLLIIYTPRVVSNNGQTLSEIMLKPE